MTDKEIIKGKLLIADFMQSCQLTVGVTNIGLVVNASKYDSSFDWLVPAIKRFFALSFQKRKDNNLFDGHKTNIQNSLLFGKDIKQPFQSLVSGLEWYNQQSK